MSPSWRDEVGIYLAQRRVCAVRLDRGMRPRVTQEMDRSEPAAAPGWEGALALLDREMADGRWSRAQVRFVVSDQWVRYAVIPWSDALTSTAERLAHARELLAGVFGDAMNDWTVAVAAGPPGSSKLASAMPTALLTALRESALRQGQALASVQPQLIAAHNACRHRLPARDAAWFVSVEAGSLAALRMSGDGVDRVHAVRTGLDWARELKRLQTFGRLASASPADGRVFVDLPIAWRALQPANTPELEWLADAHPPASALHHLENLRRGAA